MKTKTRNEMRIMGGAGDTKTIWDPSNRDEVEQARRQFDDLRARGFKAYAVDDSGEKAEEITEFDKTEGKMILVPQMAGG